MAQLIKNPNFNPALGATNTNQEYIFDSPSTVINPTTGQTAGQVSQGLAPITTESLSPATAFQVAPIKDVPVYPVSGLNADITPQLEMTAPEKEASDITKLLQQLKGETVGESAYRAEQEQTQGIPELYKTQQDLSARLKAIQNEALAIPLQIQNEAIGRGQTTGGITPIQTERLRNNAIQALGVSSALEASRGNLTLALDLVDRAVAQKFDPVKEKIAALKTNLDYIINSPEYSLADKNRAQKQKDIQDAKAAQVAKQEADTKKIYDISITAAQNGADSLTIQRLQEANTPNEALQIAGFYLGAEFRAKIEQQQFERDLQTANYNLSIDKFNEDIRQYNEQYALEKHKLALSQIQKAIEEAEKRAKEAAELSEKKIQEEMAQQGKAEILQTKISLIDDLLKSPGLDSRVGPNMWARGLFAIKDSFGAGQDFAGGVHQLTQKETIDTLVSLKERGGTLGALSNEERVMLQEAATKIGSWEIKDKNGFGEGVWNVSEKSFKEELEQIQNLAKKALEKATGTGGFSSAQDFLLNPLPNSNSNSMTTPAYSPSVWGLAK